MPRSRSVKYAVRQVGQAVVVGQELDAVLGRRALGDVLQRAHDADGPALLVVHRLALRVQHARLPARLHEAEVEREGGRPGQHLVERRPRRRLVAAVHPFEEAGHGRRADGVGHTEQAVHFGRPHHAVFLRIPDPVAEPCDALRLREARLALAQVVHRARDAQQLPHAMPEQRRGRRAGGEVGRAGFEALMHRPGILVRDEQQHGRFGHPGLRAQFEDRLEDGARAVQFGIDDDHPGPWLGAGGAHGGARRDGRHGEPVGGERIGQPGAEVRSHGQQHMRRGLRAGVGHSL
jgi:hypothetical protein